VANTLMLLSLSIVNVFILVLSLNSRGVFRSNWTLIPVGRNFRWVGLVQAIQGSGPSTAPDESAGEVLKVDIGVRGAN
jgi:hypothetical protein